MPHPPLQHVFTETKCDFNLDSEPNSSFDENESDILNTTLFSVGSIPSHFSTPNYFNREDNHSVLINTENDLSFPKKDSRNGEHQSDFLNDFHLDSNFIGNRNVSLDTENEYKQDILNTTPFSMGSIPSHISTPNYFDTTEDESNLLSESFADSITSHSGDNISFLRSLRVNNVNRLMIGSLNINSLEPKFEHLKVFLENTLDILVINESKLDDTVNRGVLSYFGFQPPFRMDRNKNGGGIIVFVRNDIPCKPLFKHNFTKNIEGMFLEINLRKKKILLFAVYHSIHEVYGCSDRFFGSIKPEP